MPWLDLPACGISEYSQVFVNFRWTLSCLVFMQRCIFEHFRVRFLSILGCGGRGFLEAEFLLLAFEQTSDIFSMADEDHGRD